MIPFLTGMMLAMALAAIVFFTVAYAMEFDAKEKLSMLGEEPSRQPWATPIDSIPNLPKRVTPTDLQAAYTGFHRKEPACAPSSPASATKRPQPTGRLAIAAGPGRAATSAFATFRRSSRTLARSLALITVGAFTLVASPASAEVPRPGEGLIAMTARVCGSSATWKQVAAANGVRGSDYTIFLGRDYKVTCTRQPAKASRATTRVSGWQLPLTNYSLTSCWGWRWGSMHRGIDMAAPYGTPIRAMASGTVSRAGWVWNGYGISVVINHGGVWTHVAHMSREVVSVGQKVSRGQIVGYVGSTGKSTGPHAHVEVATRSGVLGSQVNPAPWLRAHGVRVGC